MASIKFIVTTYQDRQFDVYVTALKIQGWKASLNSGRWAAFPLSPTSTHP